MGRRCPVSCGHGWSGIRRSGTADPHAREPGPARPDGRHPADAGCFDGRPCLRLGQRGHHAAAATRAVPGHARHPDRGRGPDRDRRCRWRPVDDRRARRLAGPLRDDGHEVLVPHLVAGRHPDRDHRREARRGRDRRVHGAGRGCDARRSGHRLQQRGPTPVLRVLVARRTRSVIPDHRDRRSRAPSGPCRCERAGGRHPHRGADVLVLGGSVAAPRPQRRRGPGRVLRGGSTGRGRDRTDRDPGGVVPRSGRLERRALPGVRDPGRGDTTGDRARDARSGRRRTRSTCSARPPSRFGKGSDELAFVAAAEPGSELALPVGPCG